MRKFFSIFLILFMTLGMMIHDADAKRFGGGRSFGMQRASSGFSRMNQPTQTPMQNTNRSKWLGPLAGLAAGGLLAYLFMGHGMGAGIMSWLAIAGIGLLLFSFIRNRMQPMTQPRQFNQFRENQAFNPNTNYTSHHSQTASNTFTQYPAGFDAEAFLRDAKVQFIRLQAAYDTKNLNDLREFTTPEVYAEVQLQIQERGNELNQTDVITLNAELLNAATEFQSLIASVHFSGLIKENAHDAAAPFNETWHFRKEDNRWMVAGVQQH